MKNSGSADSNREIIDVVDENDRIIGKVEKGKAHSGTPVLHREVAVIIHDKNGSVLMQQRSFKKKYFPGKWSLSVTGHVPSGKSPEEAAHAELLEELGFDTELSFIHKKKYVTGQHVSFGYLYSGLFPNNVMITPDRGELEKAEFINKEAFEAMLDAGLIEPHSAKSLREYFE